MENDWNVDLESFLQLSEAELAPIHDRHVAVEKNETGRQAGAELPQRFDPVISLSNDESVFLEQCADDLSDLMVVLDEKNRLDASVAHVDSQPTYRPFGGWEARSDPYPRSATSYLFHLPRRRLELGLAARAGV